MNVFRSGLKVLYSIYICGSVSVERFGKRNETKNKKQKVQRDLFNGYIGVARVQE